MSSPLIRKSLQPLTLGEHVIDTGSAQPIKQRPRRASPNAEAEINKQVEEMLDNGICRVSKSPWSSSVVLVKKKDGSLRFATDYRLLNEVTKKDSYAMPDPRSIFAKFDGSNYFTFLDCASAYWCVPLREEDIEKTAFTVQRDHYEMMVMPFGLCNSQTTFQRILDRALNDAKGTESYVDDCMTHSECFEDHIRDVRQALGCFRKANIQLRGDKCRFGYPSGQFLGHEISGNGRKPLREMVNRILNFPMPKKI